MKREYTETVVVGDTALRRRGFVAPEQSTPPEVKMADITDFGTRLDGVMRSDSSASVVEVV